MRRRRRSRAVLLIPAVLLCSVAIAAAGAFWFYSQRRIKEEKKTPEELLTEYMQYMADGDYGAMYGMLDNQSRLNISLEDFEKRNKNIYEGIEASGVRIEIKGTELKEDGTGTVEYQTTMDSLAGEISFFNQAVFGKKCPVKKERKESLNINWPGATG